MGSRLGTDNAVYEERTKKLIRAGMYALRVSLEHSSEGIDPGYCDVSIRRWQEFTGQKATRAVDGVPFDECGP